MQITEYDYYEATLAINVVTQRPNALASSIIAVASLHEEYAARVRAALREFRKPLDSYLLYYDVRKIQPAGSVRDTDRQLNQDLLRLQFSLGLAFNETAQTADELKVFAIEHNVEEATRRRLEARDLPSLFIPGNGEIHGESYIDIVCTAGSATNQGIWNIPNE